tara:strand:+ start:372 stop:710 length:339 start_codon:yes stop_codon:yes gene_type:complete
MYKEQEIKEYAEEQIKESLEHDKDYLDNDISEIHYDLFNTDYYLIYYSKCNKWLGSHTFECIGIIQEYEKDNFGEVITDLSNSEKVVNMYVYIVGEHILQDVINDFKKEMEV